MGRILIIDVSSWITGMGAGWGRKGGWGEGGREGRMGGGWGEGREDGGEGGGGKGGWGREGRMGGRVGGGKGGGGTFIIASVSSHKCGLVVFAYCRCIFFP